MATRTRPPAAEKTIGRTSAPDELDASPGPDDEALARHARATRQNLDPAFRKRHDQAVERVRQEIEGLPETVTLLRAVELAIVAEKRETHYAEQELLQRFLLGVVARRMTEAVRADPAQTYRGARTMERLSEATGYHINTLRVCRKVAESQDDNVVAFGRFLRHVRHKTGRPARWYDVEASVEALTDPTVLGPEGLAERVTRDAERAVERVEIAAGSGSVVADSLRVNLSDAATRIREDGLRKLATSDREDVDRIPRSEDYLRFARHLPCAATGAAAPEEGWDLDSLGEIEAHHVDVEGTGIKGSDFLAVPLAPEPHRFLHQHGVAAFRAEYGVDLRIVLIRTMHLYLAGQPANLPSALLAD